VPSENPGALARKIAQLFDTPQDLAEAGRRGAVLARRTYDRRHATDQITRLLDQVASR